MARKKRKSPKVTSVYLPPALLVEMDAIREKCKEYELDWSLSQLTRKAVRDEIDRINSDIEIIDNRHKPKKAKKC